MITSDKDLHSLLFKAVAAIHELAENNKRMREALLALHRASDDDIRAWADGELRPSMELIHLMVTEIGKEES